MISEERFKQLADEKATVYWAYKDCIDVVTANLSDIALLGEVNVFETEDKAKEFLKYGNITRTEKFPYVGWEEFIDNDRVVFYDKNGIRYVLKTYFDGIYLEDTFSQKQLIYLSPITRENYHKALDLCVKLFKGEDV